MPADRPRQPASPLARRRARELALDLAGLTGSGPGGRIVARDLVEARPLLSGSDATALLQHQPRAPRPMLFHEAVRAPLVITTDCDMDALIALRAQINRSLPAPADAAGAGPVTLNDCLVKAIALAARARTGRAVSVGIALGSASAPIVVQDACSLPVALLSRAIRTARTAADMQVAHEAGDHADVLVANFGAFGARDAEFPASARYPIVLALGAAAPAAVVRQGQLAVATILHATLCVGEGVLDAATAGTLLAAFRRYVESPAALRL